MRPNLYKVQYQHPESPSTGHEIQILTFVLHHPSSSTSNISNPILTANLLGAFHGVKLLLALPRVGHSGAHSSRQMGPEATAMLRTSQKLQHVNERLSMYEIQVRTYILQYYTHIHDI